MGSSRASIGWIMALWTALTRAGQHGFTFHGQGKREKDAEDRHLFVHYFSNASERPFATGGTYLEMGAADGVRISNTYFFEKYLNWSGLLIEPSAAFVHLNRTRGRNTRNTLVNEACCNKSGTVEFAEGANTDVSGIVSLMSTAHAHRFHASSTQEVSRAGNSTARMVRCRPLASMVADAGIKVIHLFSLDVEGAELSVLETFDWSVPIGVLLVELDGKSRAKDEGVRALLRSRGMRFVRRMGFRKYSEIWEGFLTSKVDSHTGWHRLRDHGSHIAGLPGHVRATPWLTVLQ